MRRLAPYSSGLSIGFLLTCALSPCPAFSEDSPADLESIEVGSSAGVDTVEIRSSRPFAFVTYTLHDPDRLVIDPVDPSVGATVPPEGILRGQVVRSWRLLWKGETGSSRELVYVELELAEPSHHRLESAGNPLRVQVRPLALTPPPDAGPEGLLSSKGPASPVAAGGGVNLPEEAPIQSLPPTGQDPGPVSSAPRSVAEAEFFVPLAPGSELSTEPWDLNRSLEFGLGRHRPVRIARQEVELAQMKIREARRALYPAATAKISWTEGTASEVDFTEYQTGLQLEQPLYHSGRLMETYRQSLVNLQVAEKRQSKVKAEYALELAQEYFQLMGAKVSRAAQGDLVVRAEEFQGRVEARFREKLLTRLEVLNVEAQVNQARFQRATSENDVVLARLKFLVKLGLGPQAVVDVPDEFEAPLDQPLDLEDALQLAARHRSDIQINTLLVKFHEYEERIARAKGNWKVDLSSFAGTSASAFETESLDAGEDYFVGVKATRNWGPSSTTSSMTTTKTSPRLGQTTRTDTTVYSAELGIVDQLQGLTEIKQAQVNLEKARRDLEETKNSVFQEIQEAHIAYQKARLQMEHTQQRIAFRQEQVKILEAQASLNEALPSQVLEAIMKLTEEKVARAQALSSYYVALAKLNKAIGLPGHYQ